MYALLVFALAHRLENMLRQERHRRRHDTGERVEHVAERRRGTLPIFFSAQGGSQPGADGPRAQASGRESLAAAAYVPYRQVVDEGRKRPACRIELIRFVPGGRLGDERCSACQYPLVQYGGTLRVARCRIFVQQVELEYVHQTADILLRYFFDAA